MDINDTQAKRKEKDGFTYFGYMPENSSEDQLKLLDFIFPSNNNESNNEENKINM